MTVSMTVPTIGVIPTRHRAYDLGCLNRCLTALYDQTDWVVVVDNNDPGVHQLGHPAPERRITVLHRPGQPPNLSVLYNAGMDAADGYARAKGWPIWNVALLNDDVEVPLGWVKTLSNALHATKAAAAYIDRAGRSRYAAPQLTQTPAAGFGDTMTCWACLIRGERGIRWDEELQWWYSDNMLDLRCRLEEGGVLVVPGDVPVHTYPSKATVESEALSAQAWQDEQMFKEKVKRWGL